MRRGRNKRRQPELPTETISNSERGLHFGPTPAHDVLHTAQSKQILVTQLALADMGMCQIARELGYPSLTGVGGNSKARRFNQDAVWEISANMMQTYYSRPATCDYVGSMDEGITYSLHSMVFCDELASMLRKMWKGIVTDENALAMDLTTEEGPRGNYLVNQHTVDNCCKEYWIGNYLGPTMPLSTTILPDLDLVERIDQDLKKIIKNHKPEPLDPEILKKIAALQKNFEETYLPTE